MGKTFVGVAADPAATERERGGREEADAPLPTAKNAENTKKRSQTCSLCSLRSLRLIVYLGGYRKKFCTPLAEERRTKSSRKN